MEPIINLQDPVGKVVGKRKPPKADDMGVQRLWAELAASLKLPMPPRGVYRFKTHEEADAWLMKIWTRQAKS
jgi:hypothetical protein